MLKAHLIERYRNLGDPPPALSLSLCLSLFLIHTRLHDLTLTISHSYIIFYLGRSLLSFCSLLFLVFALRHLHPSILFYATVLSHLFRCLSADNIHMIFLKIIICQYIVLLLSDVLNLKSATQKVNCTFS